MSSPFSRQRLIDRIGKPTEEVLAASRLIGAPFVISLLAAVLLAFPDQTREIYRVYARDLTLDQPGPARFGQLEFGVIGLLLASIFIWLLARNLTVMFCSADLKKATVKGCMLCWLPRLCGALIPAGAGLGLMIAAAEVRAIPFDAVSAAINDANQTKTSAEASFYLTLFGVFFFAFAASLVGFAFLRTTFRKQPYGRARRWVFSWWVATIFVILAAGLSLLFSGFAPAAASIPVAQLLGAPAIFCIFVIVVSFFATLCCALYEKTNIPVLSLLAIWMVLLGFLDLNDNHTIDSREVKHAAPPPLRQAFKDWYQARADRKAYTDAGLPYPVFLVSAAGGALYAAEFTATALARLQDTCPGFAQHTFAISSVSGGALGAAVFNSLTRNERQIEAGEMTALDPCRPTRRAQAPEPLAFEKRARRFLDDDFMAPITAAGLFPDFAQRFLPIPISGLDRAKLFDTSLERAWNRVNPACDGDDCNPFRQPYLSHWSPQGTAPAVIMHATDVDFGFRVAVAPFRITEVPDEYLALRDFHHTFMVPDVVASTGVSSAGVAAAGAGGARGAGAPSAAPGMMNDIRLSTAVGLSARFPWVMPPGSIARDDTRRKSRLVDGGVFENSGVETVTDLTLALQEFEIAPSRRAPPSRDDPHVVFHVIIISGYQLNQPDSGPGSRTNREDAYPKANFGGEALAPIWAMLGARVQRAGMASYRLFQRRGYNCGAKGQSEGCSDKGIRFLVLNHQDYRLPLGWQLSSFTRQTIETHIGRAEQCRPVDTVREMFMGLTPEKRQQYTLRENNCTACAVFSALRGKSLMAGDQCRPDGRS